MKFTKSIKCIDCPLKCDVYEAMANSGYDFNEFETIHADYRKHENICRQGSSVTHALYLVKGTAKLYIEGTNNRNIILYILRPRNYIGLLSFFETPNYYYSVDTLEDTQVCMIDLEFLKKLYFTNHDFFIKLNQAFGKSVALIMKKIISLNQKQIRGRIAESLLNLSETHKSEKFDMNLSRKELGELSAISEENTVRILTELRKESIIGVKNKEIEILDYKLLKKISEVG